MTLGSVIDLDKDFFLNILPKIDITQLEVYLDNSKDYLVIYEDSEGLKMLYHNKQSLNTALKTAVSSDRIQLHRIVDLKKGRIVDWDAKILIKN